MKLLLDTNVIIDFILNREGFGFDAKQIFELAETDSTFEYVSSSAITDIFYITKRQLKDSYMAQEKISELISIITILKVTDDEIKYAIDLHWKDFEDAVQYSVAVKNNIDYIISRNGKDYEQQEIPVLSPKEFLNLFKKDDNASN